MSQQNVQLTEKLKQTWEAAFANKPDIAKLAPGHVRGWLDGAQMGAGNLW